MSRVVEVEREKIASSFLSEIGSKKKKRHI